MRPMKQLAWLFAAAALVLGACATGAPIYNVTDAPIILAPGKTATMQQVQTAILRAGTRLGWQMQPEGPGKMSGRLALARGGKSHLAVVDIAHTTKSYSITYRDSSGLDAQNGTIHRNYNGWIQNLDKAIRSELTLI